MDGRKNNRIYSLIRRLDEVGPLTPDRVRRYTAELWKILDDAMPAQIYQYRAGDEEHIEAFRKGQVYLSDPVRFNDPTDGLCYVDFEGVLAETVLSEDYGPVENNVREVQDRSEVQDRAEVQDRSAEVDKAKKLIALGNNALELTAKLRQQVRIACFSETIDSDLMWSHYANEQRGFAIRYNTVDLSFPDCNRCSNPFCHSQGFPLYPVLYRDRKSDITDYALFRAKCELMGMDPAEELPIPLLPLIQKRKVWSYEKEWRIVCQSDDVEYFDMKPDALYLGPLIKGDLAVKLFEIAREQGIPVYKMSINLSSPSFELLQEDWSGYKTDEIRKMFETKGAE